MSEFHYMNGTVYILENPVAQRVKVGMTINAVESRRKDANDKWRSLKVTCQICGAKRLLSNNGVFPKHSSGGGSCAGSIELPLEKSTSIAESHLNQLKQSILYLSGSKKGSFTRQIKTLKNRLLLYRGYRQPVGTWEISTTYDTAHVEEVEQKSHAILYEYLDKFAPFGEVFNCSVQEASQAVESALSQLKLLKQTRKQVRNTGISKKYGICSICGGSLTLRGTCPNCIKRVWGH